MKKQRILSALLALCIVFSLVPTALAEKADDFTDVSRSDWYYQFVDYVTSKGYFNGVADKTFAPADNMTRAMFVTVLFRFDGAKGDRSQSAFTDVAPGEWYTDAINWAAANRIVDGVGNGKFAPNDPITRAQMCTMIERYLALYKKAWKVTLPETGSVSVMVDENAIPAYALAAVKQCQRHGLVNGFEDGTFRPNELSTRAQVAAVIYRMSYLVQGAKPDNTPSVNPGGTVNPPVNPPVTAYTYALYYDANGGTLIGSSPVSMTTTSTTYSFTAATATRDGYNFLGWATEKTSTTVTYPAGSTVTLTAAAPVATLYAVWQAKAPVVVSDDLIGNAVLKSVKQANDRFSDMKSAVVSAVETVNKDNKYLTDAQLQQVKNIVNDMVKVEDVKANFTSGDNKTEREVTWNVALEVKDGQVVSAIEQANKIANAIITGTTSKPTPDDIDGFLASVKAAVESETGIVLTNKSLSEIKTQVVELLKKEGKSLWANFRDAENNYLCGDVEVVFNGKTYATVQVGASSASLSAAKSKIVKELGTAISKEIYKQMKEKTKDGYKDNFTFDIDLKVNFTPAANADIKAKTDAYTYNYKLVVTPKLNSNGLLEYKYEGDENYLRLNISKDVQKAYNDGLDQIAAQFAYTDGTKDKVVAKVKEEMETRLPEIYEEIETSLKKYDITLTNATEDALKAALLAEADKWVETNWTTFVNSATGGGTLKGLDNTALINAVWPLIEKDIDALDVNALIENQISEKLTEKKINEAWIVDKANNSGTLKDAKDLVKGFDVTFEPAGVTLDIQSVADINFLLAQPEIKAHVTKGGFGGTLTLTGKDKKPFSDALKQEIVDTATKELDAALKDSATLKDLLAKNPGLEKYLIYSALVQMGLTFDTEKTANASALDSLKPTIKTEGKAKLAEKLNDKLGTINVSSILNDGSAEKVEAQKKIDLLNSMKFDAANGIQTKTASELAAALKSPTMKDIVGNKGDEYVAQYLGKIVAKAQNLLPDGASITLNNGVTLTKSDLTALGNAKTSLEAVTELANLIAQFGDLSINSSFADPAGQKVTVNYNTRSASANLIINVK